MTGCKGPRRISVLDVKRWTSPLHFVVAADGDRGLEHFIGKPEKVTVSAARLRPESIVRLGELVC